MSQAKGIQKGPDYKRVITLYLNVLSGYNANEIVAQLDNSLGGFRRSIPKGYKVAFTVEREDQQEKRRFFVLCILAGDCYILYTGRSAFDVCHFCQTEENRIRYSFFIN